MNYLIDCGTHFFQGVNRLHKIYNFDENWTIYSFEANPTTFEKSLSYKPSIKNLHHIQGAISNNDGFITVHCDCANDDGCGQGSNILINPPLKDITYNNRFDFIDKKTQTYDFCTVIKNLTNIDTLVVKMDIEGMEFFVLEKIIATKTYDKIHTMYIEFHERFFVDELERYIALKLDYIKTLKDNNINIIEWD